MGLGVAKSDRRLLPKMARLSGYDSRCKSHDSDGENHKLLRSWHQGTGVRTWIGGSCFHVWQIYFKDDSGAVA
jgi:hypothetical protein